MHCNSRSILLSQDLDPVPVFGTSPPGRAGPADVVAARPVRPEELPPPPAELKRLIKSCEVSFRFYDAEESPRKFAGETYYSADYRYRVTSRWWVRSGPSGRELVIRPRLEQLSLSITHSITVPLSVQGDDFYSHPLVLHEFDHVRISSADRWEKWFRRRMEETMSTLRFPVKPGERPSERLVQKRVDLAAEQVFQQLIELIDLRYQELDRETQHGKRPLPDGYFGERRPDAPQVNP